MPKNRRVTCKRNQKGGGLGGGWGFTASSPATALGPIVNNAIISDSIGNCREAVRPGYLEAGYTGPKGLPGLSGGGRRKGRKSRKGRKGRKNVQSGGRYGMGPIDVTVQGTPWGAPISPTMRVPCEASYTAIPNDGASNNLNRVGSSLWDGPKTPLGMMGGGNPAIATASMSMPVSNPNSEWYIAPTAGYSHLQSPNDVIPTSAGTLEMINIPENARTMNPACLTTGGGRRATNKGRRATNKGRRATNKGRRATNKGRKATKSKKSRKAIKSRK